MALPNLAEDLAYVSLLCALGITTLLLEACGMC